MDTDRIAARRHAHANETLAALDNEMDARA
jgi:hypothetical protein